MDFLWSTFDPDVILTSDVAVGGLCEVRDGVGEVSDVTDQTLGPLVTPAVVKLGFDVSQRLLQGRVKVNL